jgi:8-oxo-dGTP pyrophosphatase MutT (NUDIX family)
MHRLLLRAERALEDTPAVSVSTWVSHFDEGSLASETTRCLRQRDPEAWNAYLAEGNAKQAHKRVSADAIVRDSSGRILLVDPTYKPDWDLPGGMAEANEPPANALRRELREELGLDIQVGDLLCVDWVSPHGPWDDLLNFIFDGGTLSQPCHLNFRDDPHLIGVHAVVVVCEYNTQTDDVAPRYTGVPGAKVIAQ